MLFNIDLDDNLEIGLYPYYIYMYFFALQALVKS